MTDDMMDIDPPTISKDTNAMSALMASAREKGKGKMFDGAGMSEVDQKALKEKEGLPWYVYLFSILYYHIFRGIRESGIIGEDMEEKKKRIELTW